MAKKSFNYAFSKAELFFDGEDIVVVEKLKEEEKSYNFTEILRSLEGIDGLSIKISYDNDIPTE